MPKQAKWIVPGAILALMFVIVAVSYGALFETNRAGYVQVKQAAITGTLSCKLEPGMWAQLFGDIHTYQEGETFTFNAEGDGSLPTRFADATKAQVSGTVRVLLPVTDCDALVKIHRKFRSFRGLMTRLVEPAMRKALFHAGPHMTAAESYASRRGEFATLTEDQLINGVIQTDKKVEERIDPLTGQAQKIETVEVRTCEKEDGLSCVNGLQRDPGVFREFGINLTNFVIDGISYPDKVLQQIETQRAARMNIITKEAEAREADARAKKAEAEARAKVAETRATEEVAKTQMIVRAEADKAKAVLEAEKVKDVARFNKEAAAFTKQEQILLGEGEAARKRMVMQADGALEKKLKTYETVGLAYAEALQKAQPGALVPYIVMGNNGKGAGMNAEQMVNLLTAKTAKELALDMKVK